MNYKADSYQIFDVLEAIWWPNLLQPLLPAFLAACWSQLFSKISCLRQTNWLWSGGSKNGWQFPVIFPSNIKLTAEGICWIIKHKQFSMIRKSLNIFFVFSFPPCNLLWARWSEKLEIFEKVVIGRQLRMQIIVLTECWANKALPVHRKSGKTGLCGCDVIRVFSKWHQM